MSDTGSRGWSRAQGIRGRLLGVLHLLAASAVLAVPAAAREEPIPIGKILADPEEYHLTTALVAGVANHVEALEPYYTPTGAACYGAYTFRLSDGTGELLVAVLGFCGTPVLRPPPIADGDRVLVEAHIKAPGFDGYYKGLIGVPIPEVDLTTVRAIANTIRLAPAPEADPAGSPDGGS